MPQRLTTEALRAMYPEDKWILLLPAVTKFTGSDANLWGLDVTEVKIDPKSPSMVYDNKGKDALTKIALDRLATAAGISVDSRRVDDRTDRDLCIYQARAVLRCPNGEIIERIATREWDGRDAMERVLIECEAYVEKNQRGLSQAEFDRAVQLRFRQEALREREISRAKTESKAINRAIAMVLGVPRSFPRGVLDQMTFAVVKFVFVPDMSDPMVKQALLTSHFQAKNLLYPSQQPAPLALGPGAGEAADATFHAVEEPQPEPAGPAADERFVDHQNALMDAGPEDPWAALEDRIPAILSDITACRHASAPAVKRKFMEAYAARDVAKIEAIENWLLDQKLVGGNTEGATR